MAPHAISQKGDSKGSSTSSVVGDNESLLQNLRFNPFDTSVDPALLAGSQYTSPVTIINQSLFSRGSKFFSFDTVGNEHLVDSHLQLWVKNYQRKNYLGITPSFHKFQVRSGAGSSILGYLDSEDAKDSVDVLIDATGLKYLYPNLADYKAAKLPLALTVSSIDFKDTLISNYEKIFSVARSLDYPVVSATDLYNGVEYQHLTILNQYLATITGKPSVHIIDGLEAAKTYSKYDNLLSVEELGLLYDQLISGADVSSVEDVVGYAFSELNKIAGTSYSPFEYVGHASPEKVFVAYGTNAATKLASVIEKTTAKIGLIKVRVPLPFNFKEFISTVPKSTTELIILSEETSNFTADVSTVLFVNGVYNQFQLKEYKYSPNFQFTPITITKLLNEFVEGLEPESILQSDYILSSGPITANSSPAGSYLVWGSDNSEFLTTANKLAFALSLDDSKKITTRTKFDNGTAGGIFQTQIVSSGKNSKSVDQVDSADVVIIDNASVLSEYDVLATLKPESTLLIGNKKKYDEEALLNALSNETKRTLANNKINVVVIDLSILDDLEELKDSTKGFSNEFLIQYAFWSVSLPELDGFIVNKLLQANGNGFELLASVLDTFINVVKEKNALKQIPVNNEWVNLEDDIIEDEEEVVVRDFFLRETSFSVNPRNEIETADETYHSGYLDLAKKLTFKEAYGTEQELRPDLPVKNFVVKVQENIRLTPDEYSRNIFHIEFDITGTGLTYDIGEALGVHGRNHPEDVEEFIEFYGLDGDSLVEVTNKDDSSLLEVRSVRQSLGETLDFLGKPPKRFYEALADFATDEKEKETLSKLASSEGAADLKKRQEVDFSTYFDTLEEFKSARPPFQELAKIISPLKRREYSIASSQKIHNNAVHLLIVVVDWTDSKGRKRWGHCSKYLSDLRIGDELVVSVKPSVMKLPPLSKQPIIMSGLGTGLAPFKAFIEEKIWQQQQGMEIGEIFLFMGSRHKKEEYLYGELWEAYKDAGVLTHIGAAFSRDQPEKIYIQDKIRESIEDLTDAIVNKQGSFYLCGPTWPVPDITACLEDIVSNGAKKNGEVIKDIHKVVEDMKEEGRYILEVY